MSKHQLRRQKEEASRKNRAESKKHARAARRSAGPCSAPNTEAQLAAAAGAATKEGELVREQPVKAELPVELADCVAAPMEAAEQTSGVVQAAAPAVGSALLPEDLPATGQPVAQEAAGVCADLGPAPASSPPKPAALTPAAAHDPAPQQSAEGGVLACQLQETAYAALARPLKAGRVSEGAETDDEGPDLAAPPAARATLETPAEVAAAAGSDAPQLAAEASLAWQVQPEGASDSEGAAAAAASPSSGSEVQAAVGIASVASLQGSSDEVMAKWHDQTVRDLSPASQLQQNLDPVASGVCCNAGQERPARRQQDLHVLHAASCPVSPTGHSGGPCARRLMCPRDHPLQPSALLCAPLGVSCSVPALQVGAGTLWQHLGRGTSSPRRCTLLLVSLTASPRAV